MKHLYISLFLLICISTRLSAQQSYPIFTQNFANPYALNPSLITLDGRSEINAMYRQQWTSVTNAPKTIQADVQYLAGKKISIGLNFYNDKTILLNSSGGLATFGYRVFLSSRHILGFGLSGGFVSNQIDLKDVPDSDLLDPVLLNSTNNFAFDGQAGIHYRNKNLIIGGSLLKLVDNLPYKSGSVARTAFDPFKDRAGFLSYRIDLSPHASLQPVVYYRNTYNGYEYFEGALLFNFKGITIGGGYRTDFGPNALIRVRIKNLHAGFAYDFPTNKYGGSTGGTNEAQLKFQLGRTINPLTQLEEVTDSTQSIADKPIEPEQEKPAVAAAESNKETSQKDTTALTTRKPAATTPPVVKEEPQVATTPPTSVQPSTPPTQEPDNTKEETHAPHIEHTVERAAESAANVGHYVIVGAYKNLDNALKQLEYLKSKGLQPGIIYLSEKEYHYVYLFHSTNKQESVDHLRRARQQNQFFAAWLLNVE